MGGHTLSCCCTLSAGNNIIELFYGDAMTTNFYQGTNDSTYHITQETVGGNLKIPDTGSRLIPLGMGNMTQGGLYV